MITIQDLLKNVSVARAEFKAQNESVFSSFVIPPFYDQVNILNSQHSIALIGGRGSGKTMYLKYFSHWSQLDPQANPKIENLSNTILYWKPNTIFFRSLERGWIDEKISTHAFQSFVSIEITKEIVSFLINAKFHFENEISGVLDESKFIDKINKIFELSIRELNEINLNLDLLMGDISSKALNEEKFTIFSPENIIKILAHSLTQTRLFQNLSIKIYIDEFENLSINQQSFINGLRKHSNSLISWNVAYKAFATVSNYVYVNHPESEQLQRRNDYRAIDIDTIIAESKNIEGFFSKILLVSVNKDQFKNYELDECLTLVSNLLKKHSLKNLVNNYCDQNKNFIPRVLKQLSDLKNPLGEKYFDILSKNPYLSIALTVIRKHNNFDINILKSYLDNSLDNVSKRKFEEKQNHYIQAAIYKLNMSSYNNIPIYSGFDTFMKLCSGNVRHFLELCYQSFQLYFAEYDEAKEIDILNMNSIPSQLMHKGAIQTSEELRKEVISFAPMGQKLDTLVTRLGELFRISHQAEIITEPENNHFGLTTGTIDEKTHNLLLQALCWNVLLQFNITKERDIDRSLNDYQLNPIYAPAFGISYRKMHKVNFTIANFQIICGTDNLKWEKFRGMFESTHSSESPQGGLL